jgi:uncharacterized membrane protein YccC
LSSSADAAEARAPARLAGALRALAPVWSPAALVRALRTTIVATGLFAIADQVIGNVQVATFAAFGSFATLLLASFGGGRADKLRAHIGLALAGSALLTIGTLVSSSVALATLVTLPITFVVFFAGVLGPNVASGGVAAMLAYVLPVASAGTASVIPDRLAGWWMASLAGTLAVLLTSPRVAAQPLREGVARSARSLAAAMHAALAPDDGAEAGEDIDGALEQSLAAKHELVLAFNSTPYRPLGLGAPDQALANVVELLEWCSSLLADLIREQGELTDAPSLDRDLLAECATALEQIAGLFEGHGPGPDLQRLERAREAGLRDVEGRPRDDGEFRRQAQVGFHAQALATAVLATSADALVAQRVLEPGELERWRRTMVGALPLARGTRARATRVAIRHASIRSVWFLSSLRAAVALAAAVLVAQASSVQHGFWVALGTLSVLRGSAAATGASALRALVGTALGFVIGGALLVGIGAESMALWAVLPVAIFVAGYTPGTTPFAVGQAAFTVTIAVLFNLIAPAGWKVGIVRIEDVALGCTVSVLVGAALWPRGVTAVVADDLSDSFRVGASFLREGIEWTSGLRTSPPELAPSTATAGARLDEALRALLAEQGARRLEKEQLWRLVGGSMRLRLTAFSLASLPPEPQEVAAARVALERRATTIVDWYERLAEVLEPPRGSPPPPLTTPTFGADTVVSAGVGSRYGVWLCEHLDHLAEHLGELIGPATRVAELRRAPWWR